MESPYFAAWAPGGSYHVYNRAVALNRMFCNWYNVSKFRAVLRERVCPFFAVYSLSLVGNHYHLHGRVRSVGEIEAYLRSGVRLSAWQRKYLGGEASFQQLVGDAFARAFQGYSRSFNIQQGRAGTLMDQTMRRIRVRGDLLSRTLCAYHHFNPHKHGQWRGAGGLGGLTTYAEIVAGQSELVDMAAVYGRFGGVEGFIAFHEAYLRRKRAALERLDEGMYFGYEGHGERFGYELHRGERFRDNERWAGELMEDEA